MGWSGLSRLAKNFNNALRSSLRSLSDVLRRSTSSTTKLPGTSALAIFLNLIVGCWVVVAGVIAGRTVFAETDSKAMISAGLPSTRNSKLLGSRPAMNLPCLSRGQTGTITNDVRVRRTGDSCAQTIAVSDIHRITKPKDVAQRMLRSLSPAPSELNRCNGVTLPAVAHLPSGGILTR